MPAKYKTKTFYKFVVIDEQGEAFDSHLWDQEEYKTMKECKKASEVWDDPREEPLMKIDFYKVQVSHVKPTKKAKTNA